MNTFTIVPTTVVTTQVRQFLQLEGIRLVGWRLTQMAAMLSLPSPPLRHDAKAWLTLSPFTLGLHTDRHVDNDADTDDGCSCDGGDYRL